MILHKDVDVLLFPFLLSAAILEFIQTCSANARFTSSRSVLRDMPQAIVYERSDTNTHRAFKALFLFKQSALQ